MQIPVLPGTPPAPADNSTLVNQTYQCGGRCGAVPLPTPGAAGGVAVTAAGGPTMLGGIPWWVWLVIAILVVLVLAKK